VYSHISQETPGKAFGQVKTVFIKKLPIKTNTDSTFIDNIIKIVESIMNLTNTSDFESNIEKQIDIMVYKLYDLTYSEVKTIDSEFSLSEEEYNNFEVTFNGKK